VSEQSSPIAFRLTSHNARACPQDGCIQLTPAEFSRYAGVPVAGFLDELRSLPRAGDRVHLERRLSGKFERLTHPSG
jgi:hypothetical protein